MEAILHSPLLEGPLNLTLGGVLMMLVGGVLIYLAISKEFEPVLLLPIGFGAILANLPLSPMVESGGRAWLEIHEGRLFEERVPADVTASLFVNTETYLALANYGDAAQTLTSCWEWRDRRGDRRGRQWTVEPGRLLLLERV